MRGRPEYAALGGTCVFVSRCFRFWSEERMSKIIVDNKKFVNYSEIAFSTVRKNKNSITSVIVKH